MANLSIHSECLLFDLRSVLSAVRNHNETLYRSQELAGAQRRLEDMIGAIEDAASFIQSLEALGAEAQARMGTVRSDQPDSGW